MKRVLFLTGLAFAIVPAAFAVYGVYSFFESLFVKNPAALFIMTLFAIWLLGCILMGLGMEGK